MSREQSAIFMDHIQENAARYYPSLAPEQICVQLIDKQERPTAMLYRFKVSNKPQFPSIFVKVHIGSSLRNENSKYVYEKAWLQYTALIKIYEYFSSMDDKQFGAIRVLDYLPQYCAIFMEDSSDPRLRELFLRASRLRSPIHSDKLTAPFQNTGTWLRMYHTMPKKENVKVHHQHRDDFIEAISRHTDFLAITLGDELFFNKNASIIITKGREILPESLPLCLSHGDYAMRNILIGSNARVTVLDTLAQWRTPIYKDIGYFLNGFKTSYPQVISQGLAFSSDQLAALERAFLKGYFGKEPIPYPAIRLYEALMLLEKWSNTIAKIHQQTILNKPIRQINAVFLNQYFKRRAKKLLKKIIES